ncbi:MAG TPA: DegT/DnrJ/EryC1/StrS family aminotransferase, partial [Thermoguttaceae bacterium]|nr:DegT/DnrJ/EryC1/StrS family aminotransferase [Thermoguttaceae bacterium]
PADLEKKITRRTRLIVPVHMAGSPCDMDRIMAIAAQHGIPVLEDVAQANGGCYRGRKLGTFGAMGIFSFQLNKNATAGEGGLLVTNDERLYWRAFSAHDMSLFWRDAQPVDPEPDVLTWPQGRRMPELCGAVASVQIRKLPQIVQHMQQSNRRMRAQLEGTPGLQLRRLNDPEGDAGPFLIFLLENEAKAIHAVRQMKEAGLQSAVRLADYGLHIYSNIPALVSKTTLSSAGNPWSLEQNAQSVYRYAKGACPASDALFARSILLPVPSRLTEEQENWAVQVIKKAVQP